MIINEASQQSHDTSTLTAVSTPSSNTGLNSQNVPTGSRWHLTVRPDWAQMSFAMFGRERLEILIELYEGLTSDRMTLEPGKTRFMGQHWTNYGYSVLGARIWYDFPGENKSHHGHAVFSLPGSVLGHFSIDTIHKLLTGLAQFQPKYTRFDIAIDDYDKRISFEQVRDAIACKNYANFKKAQIIKNYGDDWGGFTIYCGSSASLRMLRFYDKFAQTKGAINSYRWEAQLRDEAATKAVYEWLEVFEEMSAQYLASLVLGCVTFVERGKEKNVPRMVELPWWKEFREAVGSIRHSFQTIPTTLKKAQKWVNHQVCKTLRIMHEVVGGKRFANWLIREMLKAEKRYTKADLARLERWEYEFSMTP